MRLLLFAVFVGACGGGHRGASDAGIDTASDAPVDAGPRCSRPYTPPAVHACANPWFPGRTAMPPSAVFGDGSSGKLALGDVDQDGRMDVVMPDGIESFGVYRGLRRDGFAAPALYTTHESLTSTAVLADFDQNGSLDVAVSTVPASFGVIATHNNAGDGTFGYAHDHIRHNLQPLAAFDTNNDGKNDLVLIEPSGSDVLVKVMPNQGNGDFYAIDNTFPTGKQVGAGALAMTTADLDGDQHLDVVLGNQDGSVTVLAGMGSGFAAPVSYAASTGPATGIAAGDLDGNGKPDVVLLANDHAFVLRNDGTGALALAASYAAGDHAVAAAIGDLNHDGNGDLVIADANLGHTSPSGTTILLGQGNATFAPPVAGPGPDATSVALTDLDGDGNLDLIAANSGVISPWLGNGDGTFQAGRALADRLRMTTLRDVTGDSLLDRIGVTDAGVVMSAGQAGGTFAPPTTLVAGTCSGSRSPYALEDLDGDGNVDVVGACGTATVMFGDGHGSFARTTTITAAAGTSDVITGDVDGDCLADVVITSGTATQVFRSAADGTFTQIGVDLPPIDVVALADTNSDARLDLIAADGTERFGNGDGTFGQPQQIASAIAIDAVADVDHDGKPDLITPTGVRRGFFNGQFYAEVATDGRPPLFDINGDGNLDLIGGGIAFGHGDGMFSPRIPYAMWNAAAAGDVDGDGYPDIVGDSVLLQRCLP